MLEVMTKIHEAVGLLTNNQYEPKGLLEDLEAAYKGFVYNHIMLEDDSHCGRKEAVDAIFALEVLIDGLKGKYVRK